MLLQPVFIAAALLVEPLLATPKGGGGAVSGGKGGKWSTSILPARLTGGTTIAGSSSSSSPSAGGVGPLIAFADFDAGNHSYSIGYTQSISPMKNHKDCHGRTHGAPQPFFNEMLARCGLDSVSLAPATLSTRQMLVATEYYSCGQDFIYTDQIDNSDELQSCIARIYRPTLHPGTLSAAQQVWEEEVLRSAGERKGVAIGIVGGVVVVVAGLLW